MPQKLIFLGLMSILAISCNSEKPQAPNPGAASDAKSKEPNRCNGLSREQRQTDPGCFKPLNEEEELLEQFQANNEQKSVSDIDQAVLAKAQQNEANAKWYDPGRKSGISDASIGWPHRNLFFHCGVRLTHVGLTRNPEGGFDPAIEKIIESAILADVTISKDYSLDVFFVAYQDNELYIKSKTTADAPWTSHSIVSNLGGKKGVIDLSTGTYNKGYPVAYAKYVHKIKEVKNVDVQEFRISRFYFHKDRSFFEGDHFEGDLDAVKASHSQFRHKNFVGKYQVEKPEEAESILKAVTVNWQDGQLEQFKSGLCLDRLTAEGAPAPDPAKEAPTP